MNADDAKAMCDRINAELQANITARGGEQPTLRDRFAMAALTGMIAAHGYDYDGAARYAYSYADAMIKERAK